ncbi:MAG: alpha/beta fold hydrolase [Myxococcota bacterium]
MIKPERVSFLAEDRHHLRGHLFVGPDQPRQCTLIACATGVRQQLYFRFAAVLAARRCAVLTFDYRGIGMSLTAPHVRDSTAQKAHWGIYDMPAAVDFLTERFPGSPISLVGHSAGGQLIGLMHNVNRFDRIVQISCSSGYVNGVSPRMWPFAAFMINAYMPLSSQLLGYGPAKLLGWGEDLPAGVALDWSRWCRTPGYLATDIGSTIDVDYHDDIRCPILNVRFTDDPIASTANVTDLLRLFPHADIERREISPDAIGAPIGHIDFFRQRCAALWPDIIDWLTMPPSVERMAE